MEIKFYNPLQVHIADLFWEADTEDKVKEILTLYGKDAETVMNMIVAETLDQVFDTAQAETILNQIFGR